MFELIRANKIKSALLIVVLSALLVVLGFAIGGAWGGAEGGVGGVVVASIVAVVLGLVAYYGGDKAVLAMSRARQIHKRDHPQLFNVVEEMAIASGQPMPKVYIIDDTALNAFATGRKPENASVAVTSGLLARLNRDELQGVIAHEMSHIKNRAILFMTLAGVLLGSVALLADFYVRSLWWGGMGRRRRRSSRGGGGVQALFAVVALLLAILAPLVARLLYLACSRRREYLADASAAQLTRYPEGLASALEKISGDREVLEVANRATAPMYIVHPIKAFEKRAAGLLSTHPPTDERIAILRSMGRSAALADYERAWGARHRGKHIVPPSALADDQPAPTRAPTAQPTPTQTPPERLRRAHGALDMVRRLGGFLFIACACGARLKVPPAYSRPQVRCPRCGTLHDMADAKADHPA